ncbi:hypothetical protein A1SY_00525 [Escherichia coli KTE63]|nr:hypothetical protein A1SY_00525 [Escherichia coli KTE63]
MTGADFLLPIAAGAAISWASYSVVAHAVSKQHISTLRATVWGALGTLSLVLGVCAFSAVGAEHQTARKDIVCADDNPECYAKTHHNPVRVKWSTKTGHRVRVFSSIDFPIRLVVTHHYIRAVLVRCNIQRYSPLLRELHR